MISSKINNKSLVFLIVFSAIVFSNFTGVGQNLQPIDDIWVPYGKVNAIKKDTLNNVLYYGGDFNWLGKRTTGNVVLDNDGNFKSSLPILIYGVKDAVPDGLGGAYCVGDFYNQSTGEKYNIIQFDSNGEILDRFYNFRLNGAPTSIVKYEDTLIIAGHFTQAGNFKKGSFFLNPRNFQEDYSLPEVNGSIFCSAPDGKGGLYIGGSFTKIGAVTRNHLAQIDENGKLTNWNPNANQYVRCLKFDNDTIFAGGNFTTVGGTIRNRAVSLDTNGVISNWNPDADGLVCDIEIYGDTVFLAGKFTWLSGNIYKRLVAVNKSTGTPIAPWISGIQGSSNGSNVVNDMAIHNGILYLGGQFTQLGNPILARSMLASLNIATGVFTSWDPNVTRRVFTGIPTINTLEVFGDSLYVGGGFDSISSQERKNVCAFNLATDSLTSWAPKPNGRVFDFHKEGNELVISGSFNSISGITANSVAKIDIHTAVITPINLDFTGVVYGITQLKNKWLVSTSIDSYVGNRRNGLAALDLNTRRITNWDPKLNGENVFNMTQLDSTIFVKGSFDSVGNVSRETIAQISLNSGLATNWDVDWTVAQSNPYRSINNIWVHDSLIYLSGGFDTINGLPRNGLAAFSINTGSLSPTSINLDSPIYGGEILNNTLYFYGFFNTVNGISRKNAAAINLLNGTITPWNPDPSDRIYALGIKDASVILAGSFEDLGGVARKRLAAVDTTLGNPNSWNPHPNNSCLNYFNLGNMSLITGVFNSIGQTKRKNLAAVDLTTNELLDWNPNTNNFVTSLEIIDSNLYVGGHFDSIDYSARSGLAAFSLDSGNLNNTSFGNLGDINCLGHSKGYLYYGGDLNTWETGVDRINITNSSTVSWNAYLSTNAEVSSIGFDTNTVYVGGLFTKSFPTRTNIAAFSTLDATNQPMNAAPNGAVKSIAVGDNELFIAGDFTMIGTSVFTNFAKLVKSTGSAFSSYNSYVPNFYGSNPKSVMLKGDTLFYGGSQKTTKVNKSNGTIYGDFLNSPDEVLTMMTASDSLFLCGENLSNADDKPGVEVWENCQPTFYTDIQFSCTEYTWINGVTYNQSNFTDSVIVPNYWGCDSIVTLNLTIDSSRCVYVIDSVLTCVRAYTWDDGVTYYDSGYVGQQLLWRDGFQDSVVSLYIGWETSNMAFSTDTVISCDLNYLWFDGQTYTAGGNVGYMSYSLSNGCDSIVKLDLTLDSSNLVMVYDTNFFCDSLLWLDGNTYYANNNTAQQISSNNSGCDTLKTLFAFQRYPTTGIDTVNACNYYAWLDGNIYVSNNNTATHTLTTAYGCDSVVTLNLTMGYPSSGVDTQMVCDSLIWLDGNTYYSNNTTATYALQGGNAAGCDSIVTLHLTILNSPITVVSETACDSFAWNGVTYYSSIYTPTDTLINVAGCDSVLNLNLTIGYSSIDTDTITACDSYTWVNGITYYANNTTAVDTLITAVGCDSIVYLDLTILKIDSTVIQSSDTLKAVASGLSYQWIECASNTVINGAISQEYVPSVTGNYKVEITNLICTDTSACFQVNLCANQSSYTFTDNGSGDFYFTDNSIGIYTQVHWSFGDGATSTGVNPNHIYQANGNYVVVLTINDSNASAQCVSYFMDTINVLGVGTPVICQAGFSVYYDSVNATVNVANSSVGSNLTYLWDFGDGTSSSLQFPSHSYATNGPFNLCLTIDDGNGCTDTYCDSISNQGVWFRASGFDLIVEGAEPVSASEMNLSNNINIYPNPVHDQVNIEITNWPTNEVEIVVRDMVGMKVFTQSVEPISNSETITINTSKWAKGTYFIEVSDEVNRVTEKIVVQ